MALFQAVTKVAIVALAVAQACNCAIRERITPLCAIVSPTAALVHVADTIIHACEVAVGALRKVAAGRADVAAACLHARALVVVVALSVGDAFHCHEPSTRCRTTCDVPHVFRTEQKPA